MGYPMTYDRVVKRNGLTGNYSKTSYDKGKEWKRNIAGDLRRLEKDMQDEAHIKRFAKYAGCTKKEAAAVLDAFFTYFHTYNDLDWLASDEWGLDKE